MPKRFKFHAIAVTIISLVVFVVYSLMVPKASTETADPNIANVGRYVRIASATWGKNCDAVIDEKLRTRKFEPVTKNAEGTVASQPKFDKSFLDNALPALQEACSHKIKCDIAATDESMGVAPSVDCQAKLEVSYRCFDLDRLKSKIVDNGDPLGIDCSADAPAPPATKP